MRTHTLFVLLVLQAFLVCASFLGGRAWAENPSAGGGQREGVDQRSQALEKKIRELEDGNHMLMENLIGCVEENQALREKLSGGEAPGETTYDKLGLIAELRAALLTDSELGFLGALSEDQLRTLLRAIEKRLE